VSYDIIFLDIELKDGKGFELIKEITEYTFVIIISSHKEYALDAFKHHVVDYLLRPIKISEFKAAVKRVLNLHNNSKLLREFHQGAISRDKPAVQEGSLLVNYKNGYLRVSKKDILFIKAQGKCSEIYALDGKHYTSYKNLKEFEHVMSEAFVRIHNSYLVNINYISYYSRENSQIKLINGKEIPVSTRKREELFKKFDIF
jgi:two-component system LytT family response regulator